MARTPKLRHHKATGRAVVTLNGRDFYLGKWGTPAAKEKYDRMLAEWLNNGRRPQITTSDSPTIAQVMNAYMDHAQVYYVDQDGNQTSEYHVIKSALRYLRRLYSSEIAVNFGPLALDTVRRSMITAGSSRTTINKYCSCIRRMFRWAASKQIVGADIHTALMTLDGLRSGRTEAKETDDVRPVADVHVEAIRDHVPAGVWAMIQLQRLTFARGGELCKLRAVGIDRTGPVWIHEAKKHKTAHKRRRRFLYFGPEAQRILEPFLESHSLDAFLFDPRADNERARNEHYDSARYRKLVQAACKKANVPVWTPHQLRHTAATRIRGQYDTETAQLLLGHADLKTTQQYALPDHNRALNVMAKFG